jgi:hypothetical protein
MAFKVMDSDFFHLQSFFPDVSHVKNDHVRATRESFVLAASFTEIKSMANIKS